MTKAITLVRVTHDHGETDVDYETARAIGKTLEKADSGTVRVLIEAIERPVGADVTDLPVLSFTGAQGVHRTTAFELYAAAEIAAEPRKPSPKPLPPFLQPAGDPISDYRRQLLDLQAQKIVDKGLPKDDIRVTYAHETKLQAAQAQQAVQGAMQQI